jgi:uncharacterized membrane-anchored protein YhcB (DUF1043 family)
MEMILSLLIGLVIGGLLGYFILKLTLQKNFVAKNLLHEVETKISALQLDNAKRLSKEEIAEKFVSKELNDNINSNLTIVNQALEKEIADNKKHQKAVFHRKTK